MHRLTDLFRGRLSHERGATAVVFALVLIPVLGFAALAVDVGSLYAERARLQVAADAAAFAVAGDCARGSCGDMRATAQGLITSNAAVATAAPPVLGSNPGSVTVTGSTDAEHWFAPVLGHDATRVAATATVAWRAVGGGTAELPFILSKCEWLAQTGGGLPSGTVQRTITFPTTSNSTCNHFGLTIRTGYAWLDNGGTGCRTTSRRDQVLWSSAGASGTPPASCTAAQIATLRDRTVVAPIFYSSGSSGGRAWYRVYTYAAFKITGYYFGSQNAWNSPCSGTARCIRGYFVQYVAPSGDFLPDSSAAPFGAWSLELIR